MGVYLKGISIEELRGCCYDTDLLIRDGRALEVKEPHGRLVDIDEIGELMNHHKYNDFNHIDYYAITVIPAERSEE